MNQTSRSDLRSSESQWRAAPAAPAPKLVAVESKPSYPKVTFALVIFNIALVALDLKILF